MICFPCFLNKSGDHAKMKKTAAALIAATLLTVAFVITSFSQETPVAPQPTPTVSPCPTINIAVAPAGSVFAPQQVYFTVTLAGGEAGIRPLFSWSVSAGTILSGQGTTNIRV